MSNLTTQFDHLLSASGPAALVIREQLMSVEGHGGVVFPATFAAAEDKRAFPGGYNIDVFPNSEEAIGRVAGRSKQKDTSDRPTIEQFPNSPNICLIDSVGSQANRIEPIFDSRECDGRYGGLVPQINIQAGDREVGIEVSILEAGHRAGDALVRCSELQQELHDAFKAVLKGDCEALARVAPTSLVFGVWDSRDTQAKLPRLMTSAIRAFNVRKLTRSAVYLPGADYSELKVFTEAEQAKAEGDTKNPLAKRGFVHVPASGSHGGVIADGGIRRDATLSLAALRQLRAGRDAEKTTSLQRYILGLSLTAFTYSATGYLRQGCNLVPDIDQPRQCLTVHGDGRREPLEITHDEAFEYATAVAEAFGVGESRTVPFDRKRAKDDVKSAKK